MSPDPKRVEAVFAAALAVTDPAERADCLRRECGADDELRQRIEALLAAHAEAGSFLDAPAAAATTDDFPTGLELPAPDSLPAPPAIPGYEVLQVLGRGRLGLVLKARDTCSQRIVALKLLAPEVGADDTARARFTHAGRAAAAIDHEHIVAIHDVVEVGPLAYFVREFIDGTTLEDRLRDGDGLPLEEVLRIGMETAPGRWRRRTRRGSSTGMSSRATSCWRV
jgi:hypothetical protein